MVEGQLDLAKGQTAKGISLLEGSLPNNEGYTSAWMGYEALAEEYHKQGKLTDCLRILELAPRAPIIGITRRP
jgi:hypothetical protein